MGGQAPDDSRGRPRDVPQSNGQKTKKYYDGGKKKAGGVDNMFQIIIDPSKCKGCAGELRDGVR